MPSVRGVRGELGEQVRGDPGVLVLPQRLLHVLDGRGEDHRVVADRRVRRFGGVADRGGGASHGVHGGRVAGIGQRGVGAGAQPLPRGGDQRPRARPAPGRAARLARVAPSRNASRSRSMAAGSRRRRAGRGPDRRRRDPRRRTPPAGGPRVGGVLLRLVGEVRQQPSTRRSPTSGAASRPAEVPQPAAQRARGPGRRRAASTRRGRRGSGGRPMVASASASAAPSRRPRSAAISRSRCRPSAATRPRRRRTCPGAPGRPAARRSMRSARASLDADDAGLGARARSST